jgi:deoxycytidylate deaminase/dephospho-CoA kinase
MTQLIPEKLPAETIILGFTGSLGSGCSYVSEEVARVQNYLHYELSTPIREQAKDEANESYQNKQRIGNVLRQGEHGLGVLAVKAIGFADKTWAESPNKFSGVILSGIRNMGEVKLLRQYPNFFLISIHADQNIRFERLKKDGKVLNHDEFEKIDGHDSEERLSYGQQVKQCNYHADVIFNNNENIPSTGPKRKETFIREYFVQKYVSLIQRLIDGEQTYEYPPSIDETFMTMAYSESSRSACLKRKVGAVIARTRKNEETGREYGCAIASGHNDVPEGQEPCIFASGLERCYRDKIQEDYARMLKYCPECGTQIEKKFTCKKCNAQLMEFVRNCPECGRDPETEYSCQNTNCENHHQDLYSLFVPGSGSNKGKLLDMCRSLHAEENAIINLVKNGSQVGADTVLYTTTFPCNLCANKIAEVGIQKVVYAEPYPMLDALQILRKRGVTVEKFQGVKSSAFFRLYP